MSYLQKIENTYDYLTKSEKKVADYVMNRQQKIVYSTLEDVKQDISVGDATILRFCKKIGYSGFADLKIAIAKNQYQPDESKNMDTTLAHFAATKFTKTIQATEELLETNTLDQVIKKMAEAHHIYIYGVGSSGVSALALESRLLRVGLPSKAITDAHYQAMNATITTEKDLLILFSLSGKTKDIYNAAQLAKKNNCFVVSITNYKLSPVAKLSNAVLQTAFEELLFQGGSLTGNISQIYIADLLATGYELTYDPNSISLKEKMLRAIMDKTME